MTYHPVQLFFHIPLLLITMKKYEAQENLIISGIILSDYFRVHMLIFVSSFDGLIFIYGSLSNCMGWKHLKNFIYFSLLIRSSFEKLNLYTLIWFN